jgi:hypothetical protein
MATTTIPQTRVPQLSRLQLLGIGAAVVGLALLALGFFLISPEQFAESYIFGFYFAMAYPLGCLGFLLIQHLTGGAWAATVRRILEAGALALPIFFILSIPVILAAFNSYGLDHYIYHWADPAAISPDSPEFDPIVAHKTPWMSPLWFAGRMVIYFLVWSMLAILLRTWSLQQDRGRGDGVDEAKRMRMLSGLGVALFVLTVTFFAFDVGMSLDVHWYSTMYGAHYMGNAGLTALAFMLIALSQIRHTAIYKEYVPIKPIHDIGKLMFAFTVLWTYLSFGQYVIIWSGDLAESVPWYIHRQQGGWIFFVVALIAFSFFAPFFLLLGRKPKRNLNYLVGVAAFILVMRFIDMMWIILPEFHESIAEIHWMDFAAPIGILGIFLAVFAWNMQRAPLLPLNDPQMDALDAASHGGHH